MKCPFMTNTKNGNGRQFVSSYEDIKRVYKNFFTDNGNIGHVLLQVRLANRKEYKVAVFCNDLRRPLQFCEPFLTRRGDNIPSPCVAFSAEPHTELFAFAKHAIKRLIEEFGEGCVILSPLIRVDIMINQDGGLS